MTIEEQLIPFTPQQLRGERLLVLAPHPDDEVIGCGGLIRQHVQDGRQVRVVIVTDGAAARQPEEEETAYRITREDESRRGLEILGVGDVRFLRMADRTLAAGVETRAAIEREIADFEPDLILAPSPVEIHPDHAALCRALVDVIQSSPALAPRLALTRVAFFEVSQPMRPNALVDISAEADTKFRALDAHASQLGVNDYRNYSEGLNRYRSMTLGGVRYAEAYRVIDAGTIRTTPWSALLRDAGGASGEIEVRSEAIPITVVVRTKDRPAWLSEAVGSILANDYPSTVVVVNDGGASPEPALREVPDRVSFVHHETSRGRSEAMNAGVRAATGDFLAFLDDDDLYYPEHLATLARAMSGAAHAAVYTDAVSAFLSMGEDGTWTTRDRLRIYARDFDRQLLRFDNYIPLPTLLVRRSDFLELGGFDPEFDLFEDWDFLLRLSRRGEFLRVPRVTCEIRHFEGSASAVLSSPVGSSPFVEAKLRIWRKHGVLDRPEEAAAVFEKQKGETLLEAHRAIEAEGRRKHLLLDLDRLERDKKSLLEQLGEKHGLYLEASGRAAAAQADVERLQAELAGTARRAEVAEASRSTYQALAEQRDESLKATFAEIERLNELLRTIYSSRTWKIHELLQSVKGKH